MLDFYCPHAVVPAGNSDLMKKYTKSGGYAEKVTYRDNKGWLVELQAFRETQRKWGTKKYGKPTLDKVSKLLPVINYHLIKGLQQKKDNSGKLFYQWKSRWILEELYWLKLCIANWVIVTCPDVKYHDGWFDPTTLWMFDGLGACEFWNAYTQSGQSSLLVITQPISINVPLPTPPINEKRIKPSNSTLICETKQDGDRRELSNGCLCFIPDDIPEWLANTHENSPFFPVDEYLKVDTDKQGSKPQWLKDVRNRSDLYEVPCNLFNFDLA